MTKRAVCVASGISVFVLTFTFALNCPAAIVTNSADYWVREAAPDSTYDGDLVSSWSSARNDGGGANARYGVLEFDISGQTLTDASLALWSQEFGSSDDSTPHKQSAAILSSGVLGDASGIPASPLSWNNVAGATLHPLEGLGRYDLPAVDATPGIQDTFLHSLATASDIAALQAVAAGDGRLILVLIADEDGTGYSKSWGDGEYGGQDGFLATNADAVPEPNAIALVLFSVASFAAVASAKR